VNLPLKGEIKKMKSSSRPPHKILIPPEYHKAYNKLYEGRVLASLLLNFADQVWLQLEGLEEERSASEAVFTLKKRILEIMHNTQDFVPKVFSPPIKKNRKKK
jgi:hypothetical protein